MWAITNRSARVLLQLAHRKWAVRKVKEYLWWSLSWVAERSVTYLMMSIMHLCFLLCRLRRETPNIIHHAYIKAGLPVGAKIPPFQGDISDIRLCIKLISLKHFLQTRVYNKLRTRLIAPFMILSNKSFPSTIFYSPLRQCQVSVKTLRGQLNRRSDAPPHYTTYIEMFTLHVCID